MPLSELPPLRSTLDLERVLEFEFVRATENAALKAIGWLGRGEKELADAAACAAIRGVFDILDIKGEVVIGEGIKDNAPGIFIGEHLGTWRTGAPRFNIALDPVDGTSNLAKGLPNSISVIAAAQVPDGAPAAMAHIPSFYSHKIAFGPPVLKALQEQGNPCLLDMPLLEVLKIVATALGKNVQELVVCTMDRPRHSDFRGGGAGCRRSAADDFGRGHHRGSGALVEGIRRGFVCGHRRLAGGRAGRGGAQVRGRRHADAHVVSQ